MSKTLKQNTETPSRRGCTGFLVWETVRRIGNDWVIQHEECGLQLKPGQRRYGPTQSKALVCEWEDGTREIYYRGDRMAFEECQGARQKPVAALAKVARAIVTRKAKREEFGTRPVPPDSGGLRGCHRGA